MTLNEYFITYFINKSKFGKALGVSNEWIRCVTHDIFPIRPIYWPRIMEMTNGKVTLEDLKAEYERIHRKHAEIALHRKMMRKLIQSDPTPFVESSPVSDDPKGNG